MEVGDVLLPMVGTASMALTTATLVVVHHPVAAPQDVPLRPHVFMTEAGPPCSTIIVARPEPSPPHEAPACD